VKFKPPVNPWEAPELSEAEVLAIKSLALGTASAAQQRIALVTILQKFACTYDMSFRPGADGARSTDFAEGKRFVGTRILNAIDRPLPTKQPEKPDERASPETPRADRRNPKPAARRDKPARPAE
jgi:hypothetical protein